MADVGPSFHIVDVIKNSIKDLQQEKTKNERKLSEARAKRKSVENKYEAALSKYNQANEMNGKMTDTMKVAQFKVIQSQTAIDCQHNVNQELEQRSAHIKATFKKEETRQLEEIEMFEGKLASLSEMFHNGKDFYIDKSLQAEIGLVKTDQQHLVQKVNQTDADMEKLMGVFEALEIVARKQETENRHSDIPLEIQHQVLELIVQERRTEEQDLNSLKDKEKHLFSQLENSVI